MFKTIIYFNIETGNFFMGDFLITATSVFTIKNCLPAVWRSMRGRDRPQAGTSPRWLLPSAGYLTFPFHRDIALKTKSHSCNNFSQFIIWLIDAAEINFVNGAEKKIL